MANSSLWDIVAANAGPNNESSFNTLHRVLNPQRNEIIPEDMLPVPLPRKPIVAAAPPPVPLTQQVAPTRTWGESLLDPLASLGSGTAQMGKGLVDLFAPGGAVSTDLDERSKTLEGMKSAAWRLRAQQQAEEMQNTPSALGKFALGAQQAVSSPDKAINMLGQIAPSIALGGVGALAKLGVLGQTALQAGLGAVQGGGAVRGGIYDNIKDAPLADLQKSDRFKQLAKDNGIDKARTMLADEAASLSNSGDLVGLATVLGAASGLFGLGTSVVKATTGKALGQVGKETSKELLKGTAKAVGKEAASESGEEMLQTFGSNLGAARTGANIDLSKGVAEAGGAALAMGAAGGGLGRAIERQAAKAAEGAAPAPALPAGTTTQPAPAAELAPLTKTQTTAAQAYIDSKTTPVLDENGAVDPHATELARDAFLSTFADPAQATAALAKIDGVENAATNSTDNQAPGGTVSEPAPQRAEGTVERTTPTDATGGPVTADAILAAFAADAGAAGSVSGAGESSGANQVSGSQPSANTDTAAASGVPEDQGREQVAGAENSAAAGAGNAGNASSEVASQNTGETNATTEVTQQKGVRSQPENGTRSQEAPQAGAGDSVQRAASEPSTAAAKEVAPTGPDNGALFHVDSAGTTVEVPANVLHPMAAKAIADGRLSAALQHISADPAANPTHRQVAEKLHPLLHSTSVQVLPTMHTPDGKPALGAASSDGSSIWLSADGGINPETVLHESVHAATEVVLNMPREHMTAQQMLGVSSLTAVWKQAKLAASVVLSPAAIGSLSEFAAESVTNPALIAQLSAVPYSGSNLWERFKSAVMQMLGLSRPTSLGQEALNALSGIFTAPPEAPASVPPSMLYSLAEQTMPDATAQQTAPFIAPAIPPYSKNWGDDLAKTFVDTANYMMLSLDRWASVRDGAVSGADATGLVSATLKRAFESAFYRARNQKAVFLEQFDRDMMQPLVAQVQSVADAAKSTVNEVMMHASNSAIAHRVIEDSTSIANEQQSLLNRLSEQLKVAEVFNDGQAHAPLSAGVTTALTDIAAALDKASRDTRVYSIAQVNTLHATLQSVTAALESEISGRADMQGLNAAQVSENAHVATLQLVQGDNAKMGITDMLETAHRLSTLFDPTVTDKIRENKAASREKVQIATIRKWNDAQNRPTHDTPVAVKLPAGMTMREAGVLLSDAQAHPGAAGIESIAANLRDNFQAVSHFAEQHGVVSAAAIAQARKRRPNYVSFAADPSGDADGYLTHNNRAFLDSAEGASTYMHGGNLNIFHTLQGKIQQAAHMASVQERNQLALDLMNAGAPGFQRSGPNAPADQRIQVVRGGRRYYVGLDKANWSQQAFNAVVNEPSRLAQLFTSATSMFGGTLVHAVLLAAPVLSIKDLATRMFNTLGTDFERTTGKKLDVVSLNRKFFMNMLSPDVMAAAWAEATGKPLPGIYADFKQAGGLLTFLGHNPLTRAQLDTHFEKPGLPVAAWRATRDAVHTWNTFFQSGPPIALYKALRSEGVAPTEASAATLSQMDLRRTGDWTSKLRTLYAFLNPAAQDALTTKRVIVDSRGVVNSKALGAGLGLTTAAYILYSALREADKDDPYIKGRKKMDGMNTNVLLSGFKVPLTDGGYLTIPIGFGHVQTFAGAAVILARMQEGIATPKESMAEMVRLFLKPAFITGEPMAEFSKMPLVAVAQTFAPDILSGLVNTAMGVTSFGAQINKGSTAPGKGRLYTQGLAKTPEHYKAAAEAVYKATGVDQTPEMFKSVLDAFTPGVLAAPMGYFDQQDQASKGLLRDDTATWWQKATGLTRVYTAPDEVGVLTRDFYKFHADGLELMKDVATDPKYSKMPHGLYAVGKERWLINKGMAPADARLVSVTMDYEKENAALSKDFKRERDALKAGKTVGDYLGAQEQERRKLMVTFLTDMKGDK